MTTRYYRLAVVACAVLWLMLGLHLPVLHQIAYHGRMPSPTVLVALTLNAVLALAGLWILLRAPTRRPPM